MGWGFGGSSGFWKVRLCFFHIGQAGTINYVNCTAYHQAEDHASQCAVHADAEMFKQLSNCERNQLRGYKAYGYGDYDHLEVQANLPLRLQIHFVEVDADSCEQRILVMAH